MDNRSEPYFFAFDTKAMPGKVVAHCVRFETIEIEGDSFDQTTFTIFGADIETDKRQRQFVEAVRKSTYALVAAVALMAFGCATKPKVKLPPLPPGIHRPVKPAKVLAAVPRDITLQWDDCGTPPAGMTYRVYETTNLLTWTLYAEVTNRWVKIPCVGVGPHLFGIRSVLGGTESPLAGKECP